MRVLYWGGSAFVWISIRNPGFPLEHEQRVGNDVSQPRGWQTISVLTDIWSPVTAPTLPPIHLSQFQILSHRRSWFFWATLLGRSFIFLAFYFILFYLIFFHSWRIYCYLFPPQDLTFFIYVNASLSFSLSDSLSLSLFLSLSLSLSSLFLHLCRVGTERFFQNHRTPAYIDKHSICMRELSGAWATHTHTHTHTHIYIYIYIWVCVCTRGHLVVVYCLVSWNY